MGSLNNHESYLHPSPAYDEPNHLDLMNSLPSSAYLIAPPNSKSSLLNDEFTPSLVPSCPFTAKTDEPAISESYM
jgi:hypothetical protein